MARRHKLWAAATRARMVCILGSRCAACASTEELTFDCWAPAGDRHHRLSAPERITFYRKQMRAGNVQILCQTCNSLKADMPPWEWQAAVCHARAELAIQRPPQYPAGDPWETPARFRGFLRALLLEWAE